MNFLFLHGGPGTNSIPESKVLSNDLESLGFNCHFWSEPSSNLSSRTSPVSFYECCNSLKVAIDQYSYGEELVVAAHSFGAFILNSILPDVKNKIKHLILVSPVISLENLDSNILKRSAEGFGESSEANILFEYLRTRKQRNLHFDSELFNHLLIAGSCPVFHLNYWSHLERMNEYNILLSNAGAEFNLNNFKSIRETCEEIRISNTSNIPTNIIYGINDRITPYSEEILKYYPNGIITISQSSNHYPHLEDKEMFLGVCAGLSKRPSLHSYSLTESFLT